MTDIPVVIVDFRLIFGHGIYREEGGRAAQNFPLERDGKFSI